jgi:hypothetical protein
VRVFIGDVGFVSGNVVRQSGPFLAVKFEPLAAVEHDLLIRKLFTSGFDTAGVRVSTWSATIAMLRSIWSTRAELPAAAAPAPDTHPVQSANAADKLPLASLVVQPQVRTENIKALVERRRALVA